MQRKIQEGERMSKWKLKPDERDGKTYLTRDGDGFAFAHPYNFYGKAKQSDDGQTIAITESKHKSPVLKLSILRWWGLEGEKPLLPEALDGKKVKITIEVLP